MESRTNRYDIIMTVAVFAMLGVGTYLILSQDIGPSKVGRQEVQPVGIETMKKAATHEGVVTQTKEYLVETVFKDDGLSVFLYDHEANPLSLEGAKGSARVEFPETKREAAEMKLALKEAALEGKADLGKVKETGALATLLLSSLPGKEETELELRVPLPKLADMEEKKAPTPEQKIPPESP